MQGLSAQALRPFVLWWGVGASLVPVLKRLLGQL
jgi:hypothetical protein